METRRKDDAVLFQGEVMSVGALLERARAAVYEPTVGVGIRHTAASNARHCADLLASGDSLDSCWRFGILQSDAADPGTDGS